MICAGSMPRPLFIVASGLLVLSCRPTLPSEIDPDPPAPTPAPVATPAPIPETEEIGDIPRFTGLAISPTHGCAIGQDGELACWGDNGRGQVGHPFASGPCRPARVRGVRDVTNVAVSRGYSCAVQGERTVACWGDQPALRVDPENFGDGHRFDVDAPVAQIATAPNHACLRRRDGIVECWGENTAGQLGSVDGPPSAAPIALPVEEVTSLAVGPDVGCVVEGNGEVWCWGRIRDLRIASGEGVQAFAPTQLPGPEAESVTLAATTPCIVDREGAVHCWMEQTDGPKRVLPSPQPTELTDVAQLLGMTHNGSGCAARPGGGGEAITCWQYGSAVAYAWPHDPNGPQGAQTAISLALAAEPSTDAQPIACGAFSDDTLACWLASGEVERMAPFDFEPVEELETVCAAIDVDRDGIPLPQDACPNLAENFNSFEDENGCPDDGLSRVTIDSVTGTIGFTRELQFAGARANIRRGSRVTLDHLAAGLKAHDEFVSVKITGHSSSKRTEYRKAVALRRAKAVQDALVDRGIAAKRLTAVGSEIPLVAGRTVEVQVTAFGGM